MKSSTLKTELSSINAEALVVSIGDECLTLHDVALVANQFASVQLSDDARITDRIQRSCDYIEHAVRDGKPIYGVTSGFGGMANIAITSDEAIALQNNLVAYHKVGAGGRLRNADVRAAMLLRMKSHVMGVSGIRLELIQRMQTFLNNRVTPHVHEFGSIGASGDLTPLSYITGAIAGMNEAYQVDFDGDTVSAVTALTRLGLRPLRLRPKEGLAMMNGTAVMTGIAANCAYDAQRLLRLVTATHALMVQALLGTNQSFHPFIHAVCKPHPGQVWAAETMLRLLEGSGMIRDELDGSHDHRGDQPIQDRYSLRCLAQFLGPIAEGIDQVVRQIEVEMNSATDNPLIDADNNVSYHGGNFLGMHVSMAMDHLRYYFALLAKHLDAQIALLVAPEFSNGLPPSLIGNADRRVNMGLKGLQITGNSLMPLLLFYGNSLADRFPTHAEQFNQNINSQGFGSANLTRRSIDIFQQYIAVALMFGIQAVDLRAKQAVGHYDATAVLSPATAKLYAAVKRVVGCPVVGDRPYVWDDGNRELDKDIAAIVNDISSGSSIISSLDHAISSGRLH